MLFEDPKKAAVKLSKIFQKMGWTWMIIGIPSEQEIYDALMTFAAHINRCENCMTSSSGRIFAKKTRDTRKIIYGLEERSCDEWRQRCELEGGY